MTDTSAMISPTVLTSGIDSGATESLLSAVHKSIEAAEKNREAAELRAQELDKQLHKARTQRIRELELEVKRLRAENARFRSARRQQHCVVPEPPDSTHTQGAEAAEARVAEVYAWLDQLFLSSYADGIVSEGYDALEYSLLPISFARCRNSVLSPRLRDDNLTVAFNGAGTYL